MSEVDGDDVLCWAERGDVRRRVRRVRRRRKQKVAHATHLGAVNNLFMKQGIIYFYCIVYKFFSIKC